MGGWDSRTRIRLSNKSIQELTHFWRAPPASAVGRSWYPPERSFLITATLVTDASSRAWGSHLHLHPHGVGLGGHGAPPTLTQHGAGGLRPGHDDPVFLGHGAFSDNLLGLGSTLREFEGLL